MRSRFAIAGLVALALIVAPTTWAKKKEDDVDYVELASILVQDGFYDRAEQALSNVDESDEEVDRAKLYAIYGLLYMNRNEMPAAKEAFYKSVEFGQAEPVIYIYLAQIHFGLEEYRDAIEAIDKAGETAARLASVYTMKAHAHWLLSERGMTWAVLDDASNRFPSNHTFLRRKVFYLIELGLYQEASQLGRTYLSLSNGGEKDYIQIGNALRKSGQYDEALQFLQTARLKFPSSATVTRVLGHTYLDIGNLYAAADLISEAASLDPTLTGEAAEVQRRAGKPYQALSLNSRVADQAEKLKQRLSILLSLERHDAITAMEPALNRAQLMQDEDIRYALAYANFKIGDYEKTEEHLVALKRSDLFKKATELRRIMADCQESRWRCS